MRRWLIVVLAWYATETAYTGELTSYSTVPMTKGPSTGESCKTSCDGLPDGHYQSCEGCHVYITCSGNETYPDRCCPQGFVWDDNQKRCHIASTTCYTCIRNCTGIENGNYQSCATCSSFIACSNGNREVLGCPEDLVWDDQSKRCEDVSTTCNY